MNIEKMLAKCGDFGCYQYMLMALFGVINVISSLHYYSQTIISFVPDHWCYSDALTNKTFEEIRKIYSNYPNPSCSVLNESTTSINILNKQSDIITTSSRSLFYKTDKDEKICNKWIYHLDFGYQSMTCDLNWVCDSAWKSTMGQSMFFIGSVIGSLILGILADKIGRLPVLILANILAMFGNGVTVFSTNVIAFSIARFISGLATDSNFVMMYILVMEYIRPSMRTFGLNICIGIFYCIGSVIAPWVAVGLGNWQLFLWATAAPIVIVPIFYFVLVESALWLISKNDVDGAIICFKRVAKFNGNPLMDDDIDEFRTACAMDLNTNTSKNSAMFFDLFKTPRLRRNTLILLFKSMVITLCYDAISRNVEGLGISSFVMFSLSATAIFPACVIILLLQDRIGRKAMASSSLLISGIFTAATGIIIVYEHGIQNPILLVTLAIIGRFGVTIAYNSGAQYATELIPTCVRGQGVAAVHVAGYALTFFSSYILYLANIFKPLPSLLLGILSLAGAVLVLFLPETLNRTIPCSLKDGELFGRGERIFDFSCFERRGDKLNSAMQLQLD